MKEYEALQVNAMEYKAYLGIRRNMWAYEGLRMHENENSWIRRRIKHIECGVRDQ